ncbi:MAG TPA: Ig-like domain-containing protein, partial [Spirochaetia bacterium]|nr:Ig-like domain-containing protein [Spirochaetia bacterium]
ATGTSLWSSSIDTSAAGTTAPDAYRLRVVAIDSLGNVGTPAETALTVDQQTDRPTLSFTNLNSSTPSRLPVGNISITGTITDSDGVDPTSIQIRVDRNGDGLYDALGEGWVSVSNPPPSMSSLAAWSHTITDLTSQGLKHVQIRAHDIKTDNAHTDYATGFNWQISPSVAFYVDSGPPVLDLTSPTIGQRFNTASFPLAGSTNDSNGIQKLKIWVDDNDNQVEDAGESVTYDGGTVAATAMVAGFTYTVGTANTTDFVPLGSADNNAGTVFVYNGVSVAAHTTGTVGTLVHAPLQTNHDAYAINVPVTNFSNSAKPVKAVQVTSYSMSWASTTRDLTVAYDPIVPTVTVNTPANDATINGSIKVSGLADDNYQLSKVYYSLVTAGSTAPTFPSGYTELTGQTYSWNFTLDTTVLTDGDYTLRVVALDSAGNASTPLAETLHVLQSSDRPVVSVLTLNQASTAYQNVLPASLQINGTVNDDDGVAHQYIQIRTQKWDATANAGAGAYGAWSAWAAVTGPPASDVLLATWSHTFTGFTDGLYQLQVRSADVFDGGQFLPATYSWGTSATVAFSIDLNPPTGIVTSPSQAAWTRTSQPIAGTASDANGIKSVTIAYNTGSAYGAEKSLYTYPGTGAYPGTQPWADTYVVNSNGSTDGLTNYRVTITDAFNKVTTYERYFTVDTQAPTISFSTPSAAAVVAGSVLARGTSSDANAITKVYIKALNGTDPGLWAPGTVPTDNGWIVASGTYNWSNRFKSTGLSDGSATLFVMAEDVAGNRSDPTQAANQLAFTVNQSINLPVITFSTTSGTLFDNTGVVTGTVTANNGVDTSTLQISFDNGVTWRSVSSPGSNGLTVNFSHALAAGGGLV